MAGSVFRLSIAQLEKQIHERARQPMLVSLTVHALARMKERHVLRSEVLEVLESGRKRWLHLRLSQASLGKLLDVTEQSVALWEKRGRIPLLADKHLRLIWAWKNDGNETIVRTMERLNDVERL